jgi:hypothetical protein
MNLTPDMHLTVGSEEPSVASAVGSTRKYADGSFVIPARAGVVHRAPRSVRTSIIDAAREVVIKEVLKLYGEDVPSPRLFRKYLETLSLADLVARRTRYFADQQKELAL